MKNHLELPTELQAIERKFLTEIEDLEKQFFPRHAPTFTGIIEKKIAFLKEILSTIEANPTITSEELAAFVDHRVETEERALKNKKKYLNLKRFLTVFEF